MKEGRQVLGETLVDVAPVVGQVLDVATHGVEEEVGRQSDEAREHVGQRHRHEHRVGRVAHVRLEEDDADEDVGDDGEEDDGRGEVAVDEGDRRGHLHQRPVHVHTLQSHVFRHQVIHSLALSCRRSTRSFTLPPLCVAVTLLCALSPTNPQQHFCAKV